MIAAVPSTSKLKCTPFNSPVSALDYLTLFYFLVSARLSSNLKRLFHGGGGSGGSNSSSAPASPDASASRGPRPLLALSADEARRMLTSDATSVARTPLGPGPQLLLPPTASPVSGGRLELRLDAGAHRPPPEVDPLG
nr:unnamed protein product [Spirometra erinaceieuropaei]